MTLLRQLRIVERLVWILKIGAAVLPVGVEEQGIETAIEIVMMRHVLPRAGAGIELRPAAAKVADPALKPGPFRRLVLLLAHHHFEDIRNGASFDGEGAVHVGFAESQFGIAKQGPFRSAGLEADGNRFSSAVTAGENGTARRGHLKVATP